MSVMPLTNKIKCGLLTLLMLLAVSSCGIRNTPDPVSGVEEGRINTSGENTSEETGVAETESHPVAVADFTYLELDEPMRWEDRMAIGSDWLYYVDMITEEGEGETWDRTHWVICRRALSGQEDPSLLWASETIVALSTLRSLFLDGDGNCYTFWSFYAEDDFGEKADPTGYSLEKRDGEGVLIWRMEYTPKELAGIGQTLGQGTVSGDGRIFLYHIGPGESVFAFGQDGRYIERYTPELETLEGVAAGKEGRAYAYCVTGETPVFAQLGSGDGIYSCPMKPLQVYSGWEEGIYLCSGEGLWRYIPEAGETEMLWGWEDEYVQINGSNIQLLSGSGEAVQLLCREQFDSGKSSLKSTKQVLTLANIHFESSQDYPGKQIITMELSDYFEEFENHTEYLVQRFNRQSKEYKVEIIPHEGLYDEELKRQLLQGKGPDLVGVRQMDVLDLAAKGAFEELGDYYAGSNAVSGEDILDSVMRASTVAGKNVLVIPDFYIKMWQAFRTEELEQAAENWTPLQFLEFARGKRMFNEQSPTIAFYCCMGISPGAYFVDFENRECHFDTEEFRRILEECRQWESYPYTSSGGDPLSAYSENWDWVLEAWPYYEAQDFVLVDEAAMSVGYPGWDGAECELLTEEIYAINSASENKEGAWRFLEFLLSKEMQDGIDWAFPVRKDSFEEDLTDPYVNPDYILKEFTKEDAEAVRKWVDSAVYDQWPGMSSVWWILIDEAGMYFAGDADLETTVEKIQNRVQLFLDEL